MLYMLITRNFNQLLSACMVLHKIVDLFNKIMDPFSKLWTVSANSGPFQQIVDHLVSLYRLASFC